MNNDNQERKQKNHGHGNLNGNVLLLFISIFFVIVTSLIAVVLWDETDCAVPYVKEFVDTMIVPSGLKNTELSKLSQFFNTNSSRSSSDTTSSNITSSASAASESPSSDSESSSEISSSSQENAESKYSVKNDLRNPLYIGDAYTDGLFLYAGLERKRVFSNTNMTTTTVFKSSITVNSNTLTLDDCLVNLKPKGIFILLGSNEIAQGYSAQKISENYGKLIDAIKEKSPTSNIYIQSVFPVTESFSKNHKTGLNNANISKVNQSLRDLAKEKNIQFLNVADSVCDSSDVLSDNASNDGYHLRPGSYNDWITFLQNQK